MQKFVALSEYMNFTIVTMSWVLLGFMLWKRVWLVILISHSYHCSMNNYVKQTNNFVKCIKSSLNYSIDPGWNDLKNIENIVYGETWYYDFVPWTSSRLFFFGMSKWIYLCWEKKSKVMILFSRDWRVQRITFFS